MVVEARAIVAGRFRLVEVLGEGGMGSVWRARDERLDAACAVKFLHAAIASEPGLAERFEREAKALAQLRSPHVVQILDYGIWEGSPYMAMEHLDGEDLSVRLRRVGKLGRVDTVSVVAQIARALTRAHKAGVVHRDLKPENVFLVNDDDRELVKVVDFGVAKLAEAGTSGRTIPGALLGTPKYMSPEQARGDVDIDYRSDLWSLAIVAFECLTGKTPYVGEGLAETLFQIVSADLPSPRSHVPDLPVAIDDWWRRATMRERDDRFESGKALALALRDALGTGRDSLLPRPSRIPPREPAASVGLPVATAMARTFSSEPGPAASPLRRAAISAVAVGALTLAGTALLRAPHGTGQATRALASTALASLVATRDAVAVSTPPPAPEPEATAPVAAPPAASSSARAAAPRSAPTAVRPPPAPLRIGAALPKGGPRPIKSVTSISSPPRRR